MSLFNLFFIPSREPPLTSTISAQSSLGIPEMALEFCPHLPHGRDLAWSLLDSAHDYVMRPFTLFLRCLWELCPSGKCKGRDHCDTLYLHFLFISNILLKINTALWTRSSWFKDVKPRLSTSGIRLILLLNVYPIFQLSWLWLLSKLSFLSPVSTYWVCKAGSVKVNERSVFQEEVTHEGYGLVLILYQTFSFTLGKLSKTI